MNILFYKKLWFFIKSMQQALGKALCADSTVLVAYHFVYERNWEPGKKYTYTVDLAGGGYFEENQDETTVDADLDPILDGAVIKFVSVTVDDWVDYDGDSSTDGTQPIPVDNNN